MHALQHVRFHVLDDSSSSAVYCDLASVDFLGCSIGLLIRLDSVPSLPSLTSVVKLYHGVAAIFLQLAYLSLLASKVVLRLNHSHSNLLHLALFLSTVCLSTMRFVFKSDRGPGGALARLCGFLVCVFGFLDAILKNDWLSSTSSASVVEISSVLLVIDCSHTRIATRHAGLDLTCGLV